MLQNKWKAHIGAMLGAPLFVAGLVAVSSQESVAQGGPPPVGGPLPGLTQQQMQRFDIGRNEFLQNETPATGLGPVFNGVSCAQCHQAGAPGGASANLGISVVTRIGAMVNGQYSDLEDFGGALIQARSLREIIPNHPVAREVVPPQPQFTSRRITTPIFGNGLIEAIPAATILSRSGVSQGNGVMGMANMVFNPETGATEVGRFGWKSQVSSVHVFAADAYLNEMGITNPLFPNEVRPQGQPIPPGGDAILDPEDLGNQTNAITDFMRFNNAPPPAPATNTSRAGMAVFNRIACGSCHTPSMTTGTNPVAALSNKVVNLYSDLLVHRMGPGLADGVRQGQASGDQWRTSPLWGLRFRLFLMHDGRSRTVDQAIRQHGGEAARIRDAYLRLNRTDQQNLQTFVLGL